MTLLMQTLMLMETSTYIVRLPHGFKTDKEFVNTLEDNLRKLGAMDKLMFGMR
jgi:hypothetical protein